MLRLILWSQFHFSLIYGGERERDHGKCLVEKRVTSFVMHMTQLVG